jgi:hypothetical protein
MAVTQYDSVEWALYTKRRDIDIPSQMRAADEVNFRTSKSLFSNGLVSYGQRAKSDRTTKA